MSSAASLTLGGAAALLLTACASIIEGNSQTLTFNSNPLGASCALTRNGVAIGNVTTPGGIVVEKTKHDISAVCSKDGYDDSTIMLKSGIAPATFGNIVLGGGIGWAIDSASGADNKYPEITNVYLNRRGDSSVQPPPAPQSPAEPRQQQRGS